MCRCPSKVPKQSIHGSTPFSRDPRWGGIKAKAQCRETAAYGSFFVSRPFAHTQRCAETVAHHGSTPFSRDPRWGGIKAKAQCRETAAYGSFFVSRPFAHTQRRAETKKAPIWGFCFGGERGIRTPGPLTVNGFQDRRIRPLCHLSGCFWSVLRVQK